MSRVFVQDRIEAEDVLGEHISLNKDLIIGEYLYRNARCYRKKDAAPVTLSEVLEVDLPDLGRD